MTRAGPVDRVRARLSAVLDPTARRSIPHGYQRLGSVLVVRLPEPLRPHFPEIAEAFAHELGVATVLRPRGPVSGEYRVPSMERLYGTVTETEVRENGVMYRFDAARIMFAAGNRTERRRLVARVRPGESIADLFAGIGYFTLPLAVLAPVERVAACEANPVSLRYLEGNVRRNRVGERVEVFAGPNEEARLPLGGFDRVLLGYLPSALPWVPGALPLLRPDGGWMHVHLVVGTREGLPAAESAVRAALAGTGAAIGSLEGRSVKPYGPGRLHAVVDAQVRPPAGPSG